MCVCVCVCVYVCIYTYHMLQIDALDIEEKVNKQKLTLSDQSPYRPQPSEPYYLRGFCRIAELAVSSKIKTTPALKKDSER